MFIQLPTSLKPHHPSPFLHGCPSLLPKLPFLSSFSASPLAPPSALIVRAMKSMQGRVVCATNDKTLAVEVVRLAPHPKYMRRVRKKKTYQAHDPDNRFKVGDFVQLEKTRPISKTKTFLATPVTDRHARRADAAEPATSDALDLARESQQQEAA